MKEYFRIKTYFTLKFESTCIAASDKLTVGTWVELRTDQVYQLELLLLHHEPMCACVRLHHSACGSLTCALAAAGGKGK